MLGMDEALSPKVSGSFGGIDTFTGCVGVNGYTGSCGVESDGKILWAAMVMRENADFRLLPTSSGKLAALNRLETPL